MRLKCYRALTAILVLILLISGCASAEKTIVLTFTGDVTLGGKDEGRNLDTSFESVAKAKGDDYFFANFTEMFGQDDLTVINLEGVLTDSPANGANKKHAFRGNTGLVSILKAGFIDAASLANNHSGDYGQQGLASTKKALEENGIAWFQDYDCYMYEKDGIRIAFFSLQNSVLYTKRAKFYKAVREARENGGANAVVICWHTGTEYKGFHNADTERWAQSLIDNGADLVIINHPHCAQGMGIYNNRSIFYSLGNFVFGGNPMIRAGKDSKDPYAISLYAMVVQAKLTFSNEGRYLGQQATVYPVFSSSTRPDYKLGDGFPPSNRIMFPNNFQPMRLTMEQASAVYECIRRDSTTEIPAMTEKDGLAEICFPYLPAFDDVMLPEDSDSDGGTIGQPEASNPRPTREDKGNKDR